MIPELETALRAVRRRARTNGFLVRLVPWTAVALLVAGALALCLRALVGTSVEEASLFLTLAPAAAFAALLAARRAAPTSASAVAWLDVRSGGRGTLLADYELGDSRWRGHAEAALERVGALPGLSADGVLRRGLPAAAFAAACLLVPIPSSLPGLAPNLFDATAERLREKLEVLEEELALDEETTAELEARFEDLEAKGNDASPEAMFEAFDRLESRLEELALAASEAAERALDEASEAARDANDDPDEAREHMAEALSELAAADFDPALLDDLASELGSELSESLSAELLAGLDPAALGDLARELSELTTDKLATLAEAGLLDAAKLSKAKPMKFTEIVIHDCDEDCKAGGT